MAIADTVVKNYDEGEFRERFAAEVKLGMEVESQSGTPQCLNKSVQSADSPRISGNTLGQSSGLSSQIEKAGAAVILQAVDSMLDLTVHDAKPRFHLQARAF